MFVPVLLPPAQLIKVKTEVRFQAEDPWNGNRRGTFTVDTYVNALRSIKAVSADLKEPAWTGGFHRALRSEADGLTRFLPESLIELWLTHQVTSEGLPGLLREIEPQLKKSDYRPILHNGLMRAWVIIECVLCAFLVALSIVAVVHAPAPLWIGLAVVLGTAGACWNFLYLFYFRKILRRKRQMQWLLERIHADSPGTAAPLNRSTEKEPAQLTTPPKTPEQPEQPARKFVFSIVPIYTDVVALLSNLRAAFPELEWEGGEGQSGRAHLAGESRGRPSKVGLHLLCGQPPEPFIVTIRLEPAHTASAEAEILRRRVIMAVRPSKISSLTPRETTVCSTTLEEKAIEWWNAVDDPSPKSAEIAQLLPPKDFRFVSIIDVPEVMVPAMERRLREAFPELKWEDHAENWDKVHIEGTSRETLQPVTISVARKESPGPFRLWIKVSARNESEAMKIHREIVERFTPALSEWSESNLPKLKPRPPAGIDIDQEETVGLVFPLGKRQVRLIQTNVVILISQILLEALSRHGEILDSRAKAPGKYPSSDDEEGRAARRRGAVARAILDKAVTAGPGDDFEVQFNQVHEAHFLIGELLENGLAQVDLYGTDGRALGAQVGITVQYFGSHTAPTGGFGYISYSAAYGEARKLGEFLRLNWWISPPPFKPRPEAGKDISLWETVDLRTPIERPCIAIRTNSASVLVSQPLLQSLSAHAATIPYSTDDDRKRLERMRGVVAQGILDRKMEVGADGNGALDFTALKRDELNLIGQLLENGFAEVTLLGGSRASCSQVQVLYEGRRLGPTAGFGNIHFSAVPGGRQSRPAPRGQSGNSDAEDAPKKHGNFSDLFPPAFSEVAPLAPPFELFSLAWWVA